jgi:hypothetical protein
VSNIIQALVSDLGVSSCSKALVQHICDGPMHNEPLDNPDLSSPDRIPLSTAGCVCLVAYWVFSAAVFGATATRPDPEMHIFPEHFAVVDKFLQDDAHAVIQRRAGTVEALIALGLWLHRAGRLSTDPSSPLANPTGSPEDPTSDFMRYTHLVTLVALYHPSLRVRDAACALAAAVLHADPEDDDRLRILEDLLENCMFSTLKARAVAWLMEEIVAAVKSEKEQKPPNLFATPLALETLQYFVFPPLGHLVDLSSGELAEHLASDMPFLLQAVNFALFLWGSASTKDGENPWKGVIPVNMEATVRERWFEPLKEVVGRVGQPVGVVARETAKTEEEKTEEDALAGLMSGLTIRGGEIEVLKERIARLEAVGVFPPVNG